MGTARAFSRALGWLLVGLASLACERPPADVLLVTIDTLRADEIGSYAGGESVTPNLDRMAAEGTLFERAHAVMPLTRPSHASMLTSLYPREHGVLNNSISLADEQRTLAEILGEQGYRTGGVVSVKLLDRGSGMAQGFEFYGRPEEERERPAGDSVTQVLEWIAGLRDDERFFAWVHLFDPHLPYDPSTPPDGLDPDLAAHVPRISWDVLEEIGLAADGHLSRALLDHARSLYRAEVAYVDVQLGRLLEGVAELRDLDRVLLLVTADHGECFENGVYFEHADCLYEGALRVPLIVRHPREFEPGERVRAAASGVDIAPTVLHALDLPIPPSFSGRPLQQLRDADERYVLIQHPFYHQRSMKRRDRSVWMRSVGGEPVSPLLMDIEQVGLAGSRWKYIRTGDREELYAMTPDVDEKRNLADDRADVRDELRAALDAELVRHPLTSIEPESINDELLETLRALGYVE